jgi:hypothetical protein
MDQNKNQGQQNPDQKAPQQGSQKDWNQEQNPNREPSEGSRQPQMPGRDQTGEKWNKGDPGGISNRGMDRDLEEQEELPERESDQSER